MGGGGGYSRDESYSRSSSSNWTDSYRPTPTRSGAASTAPRERAIKSLVNPLKVAVPGSQQFRDDGQPIPGTMKFRAGKRRFECFDFEEDGAMIERTPIVIAFDQTKSRGNDLPVIFDKLPMIIGQLIGKGYCEHPSISWCAIGDATCDKMPIQACYFENDTRLDEGLRNIYLERGGGGTGQESYELAAYLYGTRSDLHANTRHGKKGYFFFIGDEGFYPTVSKAFVEKYLGDTLESDMDSSEAFRLLQEKYEVFFIYPKKSWQERRADIDAEIQARVTAAGGQHDNVDIRCSLSWENGDDLDLHATGPDGHIYFNEKWADGNKILDVDANGGGTTTRKPVENISWPYGKAKKGTYRFYVRFYARHETSGGEVPYKLELEVNDGRVIEHAEGALSRATGGSTVSGLTPAFVVEYDPVHRLSSTDAEQLIYAGYDDEVIKAQWASVIPEENILIMEDPKAIGDVIIGVLALRSGSDLEAYDADLASRDQTDARRAEVADTLRALDSSSRQVTVEGDLDALSEMF